MYVLNSDFLPNLFKTHVHISFLPTTNGIFFQSTNTYVLAVGFPLIKPKGVCSFDRFTTSLTVFTKIMSKSI